MLKRVLVFGLCLCLLPILPLVVVLLVLQGKWTRARVLRLPEAEGQRQGVVFGGGEQVRSLLIIGDSAAAGVGVAQQSEALAGQLLKTLAKQLNYRQLQWGLQAETGRTSGDLLALLEGLKKGQTEDQDEEILGRLKAPVDIVVVSIGVNDVSSGTSQKQWRRNLAGITALLQQEFSAKQIIYSGMPPMHRFPALPQPLRWCLGFRARQLDSAMRDFCVANTAQGCRYLPLPYPEEAALIAADGFHPGAGAYRLWAELLAEDISAAFSKGGDDASFLSS